MSHPSNRPTVDTLDDLFTYHPPTGDQPERYEAIRVKAKELAGLILEMTPGCADQSAALRKVREAVMTANAAIALEPAEEGGEG